jgi:HD-GYP domain-containing protein (c-di-GMP phosphodiesterase class II)
MKHHRRAGFSGTGVVMPPPADPRKPSNRFMETKVLTKNLRVGMFVADLDRPWIDTPFPIQGFVIEDANQIRQLQRHCQFVIVDGARSTGDEYVPPPAPPKPAQERSSEPRVHVTTVRRSVPSSRAAKRTNDGDSAPQGAAAAHDGERGEGRVIRAGPAAEAASTPRGNLAPVEAPPLPPAQGGMPGGNFIANAIDRLRGLFQRSSLPLPADPVELPPETPPRASVLPSSIQITIYEDVRTVEEELSPAKKAFTRTSEVLEKLVSDIRGGNRLEIERVEEVVDEMVDSMVRNPDALMWVARLRERDITTYGHGVQVAVYLVAFGRHLGFPKPQLADLGTIGLLLDIGKIRLPRELLEKQGRLTSGEFETVKAHVQHGLDILEETPNFHVDVIEGIAQHHERMNGSGYPRGTKELDISIFGRMAGIADCFAALTKPRPYADAVSSYEALRSLSGWAGEYFHEPLVEQFVQAVGVFPVGSLVELSSGEVAVVVTHNKVRRLKPRVLVITGPDKTPAAYPVMIDMLYEPKLAGDQPVYIRRGLASGAYGLDAREHYLS